MGFSPTFPGGVFEGGLVFVIFVEIGGGLILGVYFLGDMRKLITLANGVRTEMACLRLWLPSGVTLEVPNLTREG